MLACFHTISGPADRKQLYGREDRILAAWVHVHVYVPRDITISEDSTVISSVPEADQYAERRGGAGGQQQRI